MGGTFCSFFNHSFHRIFIMIGVKNHEAKKSSTFRSHENGDRLRFYYTRCGTSNFIIIIIIMHLLCAIHPG